jgi:hypothetical protein
MAKAVFLAVLGAESVDEVSIEALRDYVKGQVIAYEKIAQAIEHEPESRTFSIGTVAGVYRQANADVSEVLEVLDSLVTRYGVYDKLFGALRTVEALKEDE